MIYVVLGMHKSGTTLVSELLHQSGINMVEEFDTEKDYYSGNKVERESTLALNQEILRSTQVFSLDISTDNSHLRLGEEQNLKMQEIVIGCNTKYANWGFKDPRTSLTYPLWQRVLPSHKIIVVYRDPYHVVDRYRRRAGYLRKWSIAKKAYATWTETNKKLLDVIASTDYPLLVISYNDLLKNEETFRLLSDFIDLPLVDIRKTNNHKQRKPDLMFKVIDFLYRKTGTIVFQKLEASKSLKYKK